MTAAVNRIISESWRALLAGFFGVAATAALVVCVTILEHALVPSDSETSLEDRVPVLWIVTWPAHLCVLLFEFPASLVATLLTYVAIFSLAAYLVIRGRRPRVRLL